MAWMPPWRAGLRVGVLLALALAAPARADGSSALDRARQAVDNSDYLGARAALADALKAGTAGPDDLADIYRLTGIVEGALGDRAKATDAFARWIALDPKAALPAGTSPKITRPFAAARRAAGPPLDVQIETSAQPPSITLVVAADPLHLVAGARVEVSADHGPERTLDATGTDRIAIALPHGARLDLRAQAVDAYGNRVVELGSHEVPIVITGAGVPVAPRPLAAPVARARPHRAHPRPVVLRWWLWGGVSVAVFAGASYAGLSARSEVDQLNAIDANSSAHSFDEAKRVEASARRDIVLFDAGAAAAGALAVGAAILYLTEPHARHTETRVGAVPLSGGAAVVLGGSF